MLIKENGVVETGRVRTEVRSLLLRLGKNRAESKQTEESLGLQLFFLFFFGGGGGVGCRYMSK